MGGFISACKHLLCEDVWHLWVHAGLHLFLTSKLFIFVQSKPAISTSAWKLIQMNMHVWCSLIHTGLRWITLRFARFSLFPRQMQTQRQKKGEWVQGSLLWWTGADTARCLVNMQSPNVGWWEELTCTSGALGSQVLFCSRLVSLQGECVYAYHIQFAFSWVCAFMYSSVF